MSRKDVPIGGIVAHIGEGLDEIADNWRICDGSVLDHAGSPLDGKTLPNLTDSRFLMGTRKPEELGSTGGTNQVTTDGNHSHGGQTGSPASGGAGADSDGDFSAAVWQHHHKIYPEGAHDHGGENRPNWYGVVYLIRVK